VKARDRVLYERWRAAHLQNGAAARRPIVERIWKEMKLRMAVMTAALAALTSVAAFAAAVDGKWTAQTQGKNGTQTQTLTLKSDGNKLTGKMEGGRGGAVDISNGTVNGNDVAFDVAREFNGKKVEQHYKGTLAGSDLKLTAEGGGRRGGSRELVFKKQ
jgi:hypothetical protein